jgi:imidazolonepropionase-like amidohydrolase
MTVRAGAALLAACAAVLTTAAASVHEFTPLTSQQATPPATGGRGQAGRGSGQPITMRAARVLDGRGNQLTNSVVEVQGSKIVAIDQRTGPVTNDLGDVTLLPGMIDVHVHLNWYFGPGGKYGERDVPAAYAIDAVLENARKTLMAGFTTVQSVGWAQDKALREAIAAGVVVGPRLLSSLGQIQPGNQTPDQLRQRVRALKTEGADLIKVFASGSIRDGGKMNVTQEQLDAICGEAKAQGLRTLVHAHSPESIIATVKAGCTQVEHGGFANDEAIKAMKDANVFFDPNIGLVLQNYIENKDKYMGSGNFNAEGFAFMEKAVPTFAPIFNKALKAGLRMPLGTDAVAGAHGQNAREAIVRVIDGGQSPGDAIVSATSLAAESMNLGDQIGTLKAGYEADIVAVRGDPIKDITKLRDVAFVMKGGRVYKTASSVNAINDASLPCPVAMTTNGCPDRVR